MEQNRITDKELQLILDYFKQFQIRLSEMNIDDLILKLKENRLTDKEKAEVEEDFATMRHPGPDVVPVDEFRALIRKFRREKKGHVLPSGWPFPHDLEITPKVVEEIDAHIAKLLELKKRASVVPTDDDILGTPDTCPKPPIVIHANPNTRDNGGFTDEEIAAIIAAANAPKYHAQQLDQAKIDTIVELLTAKLRNNGPLLTKEEMDALMELLKVKLRDAAAGPVLTQPEIDAIVDALTAKLRNNGPLLTKEEMEALKELLKVKLRDATGPVLSQPDIDAIVDALTAKLRNNGPVLTKEEMAALMELLKAKLRDATGPVLSQPDIDAIVDALTAKLRNREGDPVLTQEQIDILVGDLAGKLLTLPSPVTQEELDAIFAKITEKINSCRH